MIAAVVSKMRPALASLLMLLSALTLAHAAAPGAAGGDQAALISIDGPIGPATSRYVKDSLERAQERHMQFVILRLDTPGGLGSSMRDIVKAVLASPLPVIGFVAPSGARAASAGTYILYACALAAMAPATNVGAATPVSIGGDGSSGGSSSKKQGESGRNAPASSATAERRKVVNDAVAYIRSLAERHGRNADWAERAVRQGVSLSAKEALNKHVIDLMAPDIPGLLDALDGRKVQAHKREVTLHTQHMRIVRMQPGWRTQVLSVITNPTIAYSLMLAGILGLGLEFVVPGTFVPGTVGIICLLVALYAFQILPVNYAGLGLIAVGIGLMVAEALVPTFGALGIGGVVAFVTGSVMLMDTSVPGYQVSMGVIAGIAIAAALALAALIAVLWRSRRTPPATGGRHMIGTRATALEDIAAEGWVRAHGERWRARVHQPVRAGQTLKVVDMEGLTLWVEPDENGG